MPSHHTRAAIVSIGDELALGQALDTNSRWLADRLLAIGIVTAEHVTVADDQQQTAETFSRLAAAHSLIISTGGLGPTMDDLTRQALAQLLGEELVIDQTALAAIRARFEARGRKMSDIQKIQACRPPSARTMPNDWGTAPGLRATLRSAEGHSADLFCLPGPPGEMKAMFETRVLPLLRTDPARRIVTRFVGLAGIGEGDAAAKLGDLMERTRNPLVGITASIGVLTCRVRYEGTLPADRARLEVDETVRRIRDRLGAYVFSEADESLPAALVRELRARSRTIATVESCTGGGLAELITDVPGASDVFVGGLITYSNQLKERLVGVAADELAASGAVSEAVARAMAVGGLERLRVSHCLAITGIAGPGGGSPEKPVGTVYIAHAWRESAAGTKLDVRHFLVAGEREEVRRRSSMSALTMLRLALVHDDPSAHKLLWQVVQGAGPAPRV